MPFNALSLTQTQRQKQTMTMSPVQRQSLDILQLPLLALEQRIREEVESNPAIEDVSMPEMELDAPTIDRDGVDAESAEAENDDDFQFHDEPAGRSFDADAEERRRYMFESVQQPVSLEQHLRAQIGTSDFTPEEAAIAETVMANLSSTGMLSVTTAEIAEVMGEPLEKVENVLHRMQTDFDPPGIAARSASERIVLQLKAVGGAAAPLAERIAKECIEDLAAGGRESAIAAKLGVDREKVVEAIALVKSLDPNPVAEFDPIATADYVIPEIEVVRDRSGRWVAQFNPETATTITINEGLRTYLDDPSVSGEDKSYIREHLRNAESLAHSLEQRSETILKVGEAIVDMQQEFFSHGVSRLKPMTLSDVAKRIGRHETTVSRAAEGKYIRSPRGIHEFKYFFSAGLKASGAAVSNKAVMEKVAAIVKSEDRAHPLSDQEIADMLASHGIDVKRRTVAKYRDILHIPPSSRRK